MKTIEDICKECGKKLEDVKAVEYEDIGGGIRGIKRVEFYSFADKSIPFMPAPVHPVNPPYIPAPPPYYPHPNPTPFPTDPGWTPYTPPVWTCESGNTSEGIYQDWGYGPDGAK